MGFNYWWWRSTKTIICMIIYYMSLFMGSFFWYPRGEEELERGAKFLMGMHDSTILLFFVFSVVVILNRLIWKKTWFSPYSVAFSYFVFLLIHFVFLFTMNQITSVDFFSHSVIGVFFMIVSVGLGKLVIKPENCVKFEDEEDDEELGEAIK